MPTKRNQDLLDLRHQSDKKASKPLMEKRRRARINHSLAQLKALVIDPNTSERSRQTKLEKADILELTVRHLNEIKKQQRTALLVENKHPKKKFEIGYSECAREVELFLSNLITPENSGVDLELQKRLQDHLNKRLQDFRNITPLDSSLKKELPEGDPSGDELSFSPTSSVTNTLEDLPLPADVEETNSVDSSALNAMLKCYADNERTIKRNNVTFSEDKLSSKRLKVQNPSNEEGTSFSCQSVTSTTGFKSSDAFTEFPKSENYSEYQCASMNSETHPVKSNCEPFSEALNFEDTRSEIWSKTGKSTKAKSFLSTYLQKGKAKTNDLPTNFSTPLESSVDNKGGQCTSSCNIDNKGGHCTSSTGLHGGKPLEQITLLPRQLPNGDWALVLPASVIPTEKYEAHPFSAFRLVAPASSPDFDHEQLKQSFQSSSPLSSTVSDMSAEEFYVRYDGDHVERMDHSSPDSTQIVWRPW